MKVIFLGTNGWYDTDTGNTICTLVETDEYFIILDAGNGIYKLDQYIPNKSTKPVYLFISHFHLDHIIGLHVLNKFIFMQTLSIYGEVGIKNILDNIVNTPFTIPISKLPFKVEIHELSEGLHNIPFSVDCKFLLHSSRCMGYRVELNKKILTYCPDTGICDNAIKLAKNADLLIAECAFKPGQSSLEWPHLNPETAALIAQEANAKTLVLSHFDANIYRTLEERQEAEKKAREIFRNTFAASDGMEINI